ncbi:hypothetical protein [Lysinibacillus piscis]|uniref:Lipoprotein n=1 Tax=Lysinibacillus piscis TaxID=2518931 RepID=A0ABQ5NKV9_9BACI|nr:hypothetical protein [Lysinibacillus sp. KH24]GLC88992.1 hypothetical protein LYSBPC_21190 [Lysinibacillus sp. KH24]
MRFLIILLSILLLSACEGETFVFTGESDNWKMNYEVEKSREGCQRTAGAIKYIGKEPMPKMIEISYDKASGNSPLDHNGVYTLMNGCSNASADEELELTIKWNDQTEIIPLTVK